MMTEEDYERQERQMAIDCAAREYAERRVEDGYFTVHYVKDLVMVYFLDGFGNELAYCSVRRGEPGWAINRCREDAVEIYEKQFYAEAGIR